MYPDDNYGMARLDRGRMELCRTHGVEPIPVRRAIKFIQMKPMPPPMKQPGGTILSVGLADHQQDQIHITSAIDRRRDGFRGPPESENRSSAQWRPNGGMIQVAPRERQEPQYDKRRGKNWENWSEPPNYDSKKKRKDAQPWTESSSTKASEAAES